MTTKTTTMTATEGNVRALAKAVWSDAVVEVDRSDEETPRVVIRGTEAPLRACVVQVDEYAGTEAGAWRRALTTLRRIAERVSANEAKRAEGKRAEAERHDRRAAAIRAAMGGE